MRERYTTDTGGMLGRYDHPFTEWLDEEFQYDEGAGDVDDPIGWFGRRGKNVIRENDQGFVTRERFKTEEEARRRFEELEQEWRDWAASEFEDYASTLEAGDESADLEPGDDVS